MKRNLRLLLLLTLIFATRGAFALTAVTTSVDVGEPVTAVMFTPVPGAVAGIVDSEGRDVCWSTGFVLDSEPGGSAQVFPLAIGPAGVAGTYEILIMIDGTVLSRSSVEVHAREFLREEIVLNESLTELRQARDPVKDEEARALHLLLQQVNPARVYELGPFVHPLENSRVTSWFGDRRTYRYSDGGVSYAIHAGIDLGAPDGASPGDLAGQTVVAAGRGRVAFAGARIVTGNSVVLEHLPGVFSLYYHLEQTTVQVGQVVEAGTVIGTVGMTGLATGPHLHWEFRIRDIAVNPETMVECSLLDIRTLFSTIREHDATGAVALLVGRR